MTLSIQRQPKYQTPKIIRCELYDSTCLVFPDPVLSCPGMSVCPKRMSVCPKRRNYGTITICPNTGIPDLRVD